jgi:hypothetical protein
MISLLYFPKPSVSGNLVWLPPYIYPESHLKEGISALKEKGYWVSLFPEGDGITFTKAKEENKNIIADFRIAFPWMNIKTNPDEFHLDPDSKKKQLIVLPIERLSIIEPIFTEKICVFPPGEFNIRRDLIKKFDGKNFEDNTPSKLLRDHITEITEIKLETFESLPVIVYYTDQCELNTLTSTSHVFDYQVIKKLSQQTDDLMNIIKFFNGDYLLPENLPSRPGIWNGRYSAALIFYPEIMTGFVLSREVEYKNFIRGIGMDITDCSILTAHPLFDENLGEVGNVVKHGLRLHAAIMDTEDPTLRFTQIMTLFEYLASPFEYEKAQKVKGKVGVHIAKSTTEYHNFCNRFEELGAGIINENGKREGYRTLIVHMGKKLEDIIPEKANQDKLFKELYIYIYAILRVMLYRSLDSWAELENHRADLRKHLKV